MTRRGNARSSPAHWDVRRQFVDGALLSSSDLRGEIVRENHLRAIHVTGVHDTWGVALGFAVVTSTAGRTVLVGAGMAYDACGREIYSAHNVILPFPDPPAGMTSPRWLACPRCLCL